MSLLLDNDRPSSLRRQLAVGLSAGLTLLWALAILGTALTIRHELDEVFDSKLEETAERILPLAVLELDNGDGAARRLALVTPHEEYLTYVVRDAEGTIVLHSHDADEAVFASVPREGFRTTADHRIFARSTASGSHLIEMADPLEQRREATTDVVGALIVPVFLLVPFSLLGMFWAVGRALRSVERLRHEVTARHGADLSPVSAEGLPVELIGIATAVNQLLARLGQALEAERSLTANAAHELRTPIAACLAQTQRLIAEAGDGPLSARAGQIEAQLKRLARLAEKVLQLARAEGGGLEGGRAEPGPVLALLVEDFRRAGQGARIVLSLAEGATALPLDPDAFAILARNLIENALNHGDPAQEVLVTLGEDGSLSVANGGKVVPPERLTRLTTRFQRGETRAEGAGLGLAIAERIARGAGLRLELHSPARGRQDGFEAVLIPAT